jgi:V8-like Glu-specific endopeptidase
MLRRRVRNIAGVNVSRQRRTGSAFLAAVTVALMVVLTGCASGRVGTPGPVGSAYWSRSRLLEALPMGGAGRSAPTPGASAESHETPAGSGLRVGALFEHGDSGNHFCTASVVDSPGEDLLITAGHCIYGGSSSGYHSDIVFIPDYRDGQEPYGVWAVSRLLVPPQWAASANPDYDFGFVVLQPHSGADIEQILGANKLATDTGYQYLVHVTGYPDSANAPISCVNWTSEQSPTQLRFECGGYTGGTSGSPWVTHFNAKSRTGTIVGVIGGYEEGGNTPSISYSVRFGAAVQSLYQQAITAPTGSATASPAGSSSS